MKEKTVVWDIARTSAGLFCLVNINNPTQWAGYFQTPEEAREFALFEDDAITGDIRDTHGNIIGSLATTPEAVTRRARPDRGGGRDREGRHRDRK